MPKLSRVVGGLFTVILTVGGVFALLNWQWITDSVTVYGYTPSQDIESLATNSGMSDKGKFHFYSSLPKITDASEFNASCQRQEQSNPILGCYIAQTNRIFIYNVENPDLTGIEEVTAAHEMLHVAYSRLPQSQKDWLEPRLETAYNKLADDKLKTRMDYYAKAEPGERFNELHAILPTEHADLGQELNDYYAKYFSNRHAVVDLYDSYNQVFYQLENESKELETRLSAEAKQLNADTQQYQTDVNSFNQDISQFNNRAGSGYFSSQSAFDVARSALMSRASQLDARKADLDTRIDEYNSGVDRLNQLGSQIEKLNKSIDSHQGVNQ